MEKGETNTRQKNGQSCGSIIIIVERWGWKGAWTMTIQGFEQRIRISNPLFRFPRRMMIMLNEEQQQARWLMLVAVRSFHSRVFPPLLYIHVYVYIYTYICIFLSPPFLAVSRGAWIAVASSIRSRNDPDSSNGSDVVAGLSVKEEKKNALTLLVLHLIVSNRKSYLRNLLL